MTISTLTANGLKTALYRIYTPNRDLSDTTYSPMQKIRIGTNGSDPSVASTSISTIIPIENGTANDDGSNQLTGSNGADNSTDNTSTYKEGAGQTDATAQNLIANDTSATKTWTIADLSSAGTVVDATKRASIWLYIKDATALAKFSSSGTAVEVKLGSDSSNYYSKTWTASDLSTGWNWLTTNLTAVEDLTETGTVSGDVDTFIIEITTNNATDEFVAGDVVYDLLRSWIDDDTVKSFATGYPTLNLSSYEATTRTIINTAEANGFNVDIIGIYNNDTSELLLEAATINDESKSSTDELIFVSKDRMI